MNRLNRVLILAVVMIVATSATVGGVAVAGTVSQPTQSGEDVHVTQGTSETTSESGTAQQPVGTAVTPTASSPLQLTVSAGSTQQYAGGTDTVHILVGATNTSTPVPTAVANVPLSIEIEAPNGEKTTYNRTTGTNGTTSLSITPSQDGEYRIWASSSATSDWGFDSFSTGSQTTAFPGWHKAVELDHRVTVGVAAMDGSQPASNSQQQFDFETPAGTQTKNVTTNSNGVAFYTFTPTKSGTYSINPSNPGDESHLQAGKVTAKQQFNGIAADHLYINQTAAIFGQAKDEGVGYGNQDIVVTVSNQERGTVKNITTTTSSNGQFLVTWTPETTEPGYYGISLHTADGSLIASSDYEIDLQQRPSQTSSPTSQLNLDLNFQDEGWSPKLAPGESATVAVSVTQSGEPVSDATVNLSGGVGYPGALITSGSVTTNATGMATYTFTVPSDVPDSTQFRLHAATNVGDQHATETSYGDVGWVAFDASSHVETVGGQSTLKYNVEATQAATGEPVANVPSFVFAEQSGFNASLLGGEGVTTNSSGIATASIPLGTVSGEVMTDTVGPFQDAGMFTGDFVSPYSVSTSGLNREYAAGDQVSFTYSTDASSPVSANVIVAAGDNDAARAEKGLLYAKQVTEGDPITFTIPENISEGIDYEVTIITSTNDGTRNVYTPRFDVTGSSDTSNTPPQAEFSISPTSPTTGESVTFNASLSTDPDGSVSSYQWDFDNDGQVDATGVTATHTYNASGNYTATLTVTDSSGATAVTSQEIHVAPSSSNQSVVDQYDQDGNGIGTGELIQGIQDYRSNGLSVTKLLKLIKNWRQ